MKRIFSLVLIIQLITATAFGGLPPLSVQTEGGTVINPATIKITAPKGKILKSGPGVHFDLDIVGPNAIDNPNGTANTTGWATYADAAAATPVDGTGGSPSLTITRNTTTPLNGSSDLLLTKGASNRQGDGASFNFSLAREAYDPPKAQTIAFNYKVSSGFACNAGTSSSPSDVTVYIYARDTGVLLHPTVTSLDCSGRYVGQFFPLTTDDDYRLILHVATTSATAWTMQFRGVQVGATNTSRGPPISDPVSWTPTSTWVSNATHTGRYWRVGNRLFAEASIALGGAPTAAGLVLNLPSGLTIDTSVMPDSSNLTMLDSSGRIYDASPGAFYNLKVMYETTNTVRVVVVDASTTYAMFSTVSNTVPITLASGDKLNVYFSVPIVGWGSNTSSNTGDDAYRYFYAKLAGSTSVMTNNATSDVTYAGVNRQTHGTASASQIVVPYSGYYDWKINMACSALTPGGTERIFDIYIRDSANNTLDFYRGYFSRTNNSEYHFSASGTVYLTANQTVKASAFQNSGANCTLNGGTSAAFENMFVLKSSDSARSAITMATDTWAIHVGGTTTSMANATATPVVFNTVVDSTHGPGAYNASTGEITVPLPGRYEFTFCFTQSGHAASSVSQGWQINFDKNGAGEFATGSDAAYTTTSVGRGGCTHWQPLLAAGDKVRAIFYHTMQGSLSLTNNAQYTRMTAKRLGIF